MIFPLKTVYQYNNLLYVFGNIFWPGMTKIPEQHHSADLEGLIGYNLKRAYVTVSDDFRRALTQDNLSPRLFSALALVKAHPGLSQSALARQLGIERSGIFAMIDELEGRGHVMRKPVPQDRRRQALQLTQAGEEAYKIALGKVKAHEARLLGSLDAGECAALISILQKIRYQKT